MHRLPPFAALRAFEAAARHTSFKGAAAELGLTPTAISHQVKQLEALSGCRLFVRRTRSVELTPQGQNFAESITPALGLLAEAFAKLTANQERQTVSLGAGPIFAARWLVPRLADFWATHPHIDLWLHHSPLPVWQQMAQFDLAVAWGPGNWPSVVSVPLLRIDVTPILSPTLLQDKRTIRSPEQLLEFPLLHHRDMGGWQQWLSVAGVAMTEQLSGTVFEDANVLLQAAISGRGVALGVLQFIEDELNTGRLMRLFETTVDPGDAYHLIYRKGAFSDDATRAVMDWLLS